MGVDPAGLEPLSPTRLGIVGVGNVARAYLSGLSQFPALQVHRVTGRDPQRVGEIAALGGAVPTDSLEELLADEDVDVVVNLTPPSAHAEITRAALEAGKHVFSEKPLALAPATEGELADLAERRGLLLGCAPDTFLGSAGQTARHAIDSGDIGEVVAVATFIAYRPAEMWHPDPTFLYTAGGGPLLDLGGYDVSMLVNLFGPVQEVTGMTRIGKRTRTVTAPTRRVDTVVAAVTTHATAALRFESGVIATLIASFDAWPNTLPRMEVYGSTGTLSVPDPNHYTGPVIIRRHNGGEPTALPLAAGLLGPASPELKLIRGAGVADLAYCVSAQRRGQRTLPRAGSALTRHTHEVLAAIESSSDTGETIRVTTRASRPTVLDAAYVAALTSAPEEA